MEGGAKNIHTHTYIDIWKIVRNAINTTHANASNNQRPTPTRFHSKSRFVAIPPAPDFTDQGKLTARERETSRGRKESGGG